MSFPKLSHLAFLLRASFPDWLSVRRAFFLLNAITSVRVLLQRDRLQRQRPRQRNQTGWLTSAISIFSDAFIPEAWPLISDNERRLWESDPGAPTPNTQAVLLSQLADVAEIFETEEGTLDLPPLWSEFPKILTSPRESCIFCYEGGAAVSLYREKQTLVEVYRSDFQRSQAYLVSSFCSKCDAHYYPDCITFFPQDPPNAIPGRRGRRKRQQRLEADPEWFQLSRNGVWAHRSMGVMLHQSVTNFRSMWGRFSHWFNTSFEGGEEIFNEEQSYHLFISYFGRKLLIAHSKLDEFSCTAFCTANEMAESLLKILGVNGGVVGGAMDHSCEECMQPKRYRPQNGDDNEQNNPLPFQQAPPDQNEELDEEDAPVTRAVVMDGKTLVHQICRGDGFTECRNALTNYKNGRFCRDHSYLNDRCGLGDCERQRAPHSKVCDTPAHEAWFDRYTKRFSRLTYGTIKRIIRNTSLSQRERLGGNGPGRTFDGPSYENIHPDLPPGPNGEDPGTVVHRFRAGHIYCVQTVQWACGCPIGWGKCYTSESPSQVFDILSTIFPDQNFRPSFVFYDNACKLLAHIVARQPNSPWITSTRFLVDVWHFTNHQATDELCRTRCNPAPRDGSQPDLVILETTDDGNQIERRAYNTETAEQFNSWVSAFEGALRQMTAYNFDISMHVLMFVYKEICDGKRATIPQGGADDVEGEAED